MQLLWEVIKFIIYSAIIVYVSKEILVKILRKIGEMLDLKPKTIGNIAGFATSMPELLTVLFSSVQGLIDTSIYNILSSNVINLIQYSWAVAINKNGKIIRKNKALKIEIGIVAVTILIPILMILTNIETEITIVPIFILLLFALRKIKNNAYKFYKVKKQSNEEIEEIQEEKKWVKNKKRIAFFSTLELLAVGLILFVVGTLLGNTLETLCTTFNVPEVIMGIALGFATSIPELITFVESQKHYNKKDNNEQGVVEATSNLFTSNVLNLFVIESMGIVIYTIFK